MATILECYSRLPMRRYRFEFVPTWSPDARAWSTGPFLRALATTLRTGRSDAIAHLHVSERGSFVREGAVAAAAARLGNPVVLGLNGADLEPFLARHPRLARAVLGLADVVVPPGSVTATLVQPFLRPRTLVETVPNPVELPPAPEPAGTQPEVALFAGEVGRRKAADVLVEAWPRVVAARPDAHLLIAGPFADVHPVPLPNAEWLGPLPRARVTALLSTSRVAVLPSRAEVMPLFLLEAMAAARPVVATPVADVPELLGRDVQLVPVGDPGALAAAISAALADPDEATRRGKALRARAEDRFGPDRLAARLEEVYDKVA